MKKLNSLSISPEQPQNAVKSTVQKNRKTIGKILPILTLLATVSANPDNATADTDGPSAPALVDFNTILGQNSKPKTGKNKPKVQRTSNTRTKKAPTISQEDAERALRTIMAENKEWDLSELSPSQITMFATFLLILLSGIGTGISIHGNKKKEKEIEKLANRWNIRLKDELEKTRRVRGDIEKNIS